MPLITSKFNNVVVYEIHAIRSNMAVEGTFPQPSHGKLNTRVMRLAANMNQTTKTPHFPCP